MRRKGDREITEVDDVSGFSFPYVGFAIKLHRYWCKVKGVRVKQSRRSHAYWNEII